jgi:hypothetical protein
MILAAAECAYGRAEPPPDLKLMWDWMQWRVLPESGGLRDQRAGELERMKTAYRVWATMKSWKETDAKDADAWREKYPEGWQIILMVQELRHG